LIETSFNSSSEILEITPRKITPSRRSIRKDVANPKAQSPTPFACPCLRATLRQTRPIAPNENSLVDSERPEVRGFAS